MTLRRREKHVAELDNLLPCNEVIRPVVRYEGPGRLGQILKNMVWGLSA
jgi:hypothetical protein